MGAKVLLLYGGFSAEKEVSKSSKNDIAQALKSKGYDVIEHELADVWQLLAVIQKEKPAVIYNGLYGNWGEDGEIQALLDMLQIPYTHSPMKASVLGMDKNLTKKIAAECGIKTAPSETKTYAELMQNGTAIDYPYVVKPICDGSSVGVFIVRQESDLKAVHYDTPQMPVMIEKYIAGRELTAMCLEGKSYVVTELKAKNDFYDYQAKYTDGLTTHILPADLPYEVSEACLRYAEKIHQALGCRTLSRSDFRYNPQDGVVFLEINTNPGMTSLSLVPEQAAYIGLSYADLCDKLIQNASFRKR
ncbi:MAG: D-alanine--D-alanine ligase [Alphaproteobacteria bacterium]|nr:D-alanine--D-alanine ligase [Alphaproteobacteria bacterium]